ncbi:MULTISPECIES: hypothetical protein [Agrobacterium]|uniref:hypothetical protein n=1 Tax=Agrobacterium TaxID=357 RepID=UPI0004590D05|nr:MULTISPECIES: hypothetical protein [Agrobacterium]AMD59383.1 hypothetical protein AWN88_14005 [Agrobacterium tumefaciens]KAA1237112.1 hypothetical protein FHL81_10765 [Agrobacterium tumefaciens]KAJ34003.1 hypothetical protein BW45_06425 [Agrobacterium tumefaciens]MCD4659442.1 hypothetical protein [Agrobacterium sp.]NTE53814.1 hypothetical protein [Agrobacterium tumefaciens]
MTNTEIEEPVTTIEDELGLLKELLGEEPTLEIKRKTSAKRNSVAIADMTDVELRAYKAQKQAARRAELKARESTGSVKFDAISTREALADAALLLLATGGPGADAVSSYLQKVFHDQVGAPLTIATWAKSGKLKPRLMHFARNST